MTAFECYALSVLFGINYELIMMRRPESKWSAGLALFVATGWVVVGLAVQLT